MSAPHPCKLGPGDAKRILHFKGTQISKKRHKRKRTKDKGQSRIRVTSEEHTQDACVLSEQRRRWEVKGASQREVEQARTGRLQAGTSTGC